MIDFSKSDRQEILGTMVVVGESYVNSPQRQLRANLVPPGSHPRSGSVALAFGSQTESESMDLLREIIAQNTHGNNSNHYAHTVELIGYFAEEDGVLNRNVLFVERIEKITRLAASPWHAAMQRRRGATPCSCETKENVK